MKIFVIILLSLCSFATFSQARMSGSKIVGLQTGVSGNGYYGGVSFDLAKKQKIDLGAIIGLEFAEQGIVEMRSTFVDIRAKYYLFNEGSINIYGMGGVSMAFDKTVNTEILNESASKFGFHFGLGANYVVNKISIGPQFTQKFFTSDEFGKQRYFIGLQVGYVF
ncbi:MAG: porin family protein [Cytophagales bacterium]|nr:porin family protein [Cytophagales bacterium]